LIGEVNRETSTPGLNIITSNRLEVLIELLADRLEIPRRSPFRPEVILVQSKGMERWITMRLARRFGIWANSRFPFPNAFVQELFQDLLPDIAEDICFHPRFLTWKLVDLIPRLLDRSSFVTLAEYLERADPSLKLYQLASRIADLFDQYLFYRPDMITAWERGEENHWQAELWRALVERQTPYHRARLREILLERLESGSFDRGALPDRISLFGISVLPPYHLDIIGALSRHCEVNLFLMNPAKDYWADIASDREIARRTVREKRIYTARELHYERQNALLASMGKMGQEFFELIEDLEEAGSAQEFEQPSSSHLLSLVQSDIFNLSEPGGESPHVLLSGDRSIQIHSCHSPMREVEVLHDLLLSFFEADPGLNPEDILVMAPDIDVYVPFIHAVFTDPSLTRILYNMSDRSVVRESPVIAAFFSLLALPEDRYNVLRVLDILESESIRKKLDLSETALSRIKRWLLDTRIKWGIDDRDREKLGLPAEDQNTWHSGLSRLLLGYSLSGEDLYSGILPYPQIEGSEEAGILGALAAFMQRLFAFGQKLREPHNPGEWGRLLAVMLSEFFFESEDTAREIEMIHVCLEGLTEVQQRTDPRSAVGIDVIRCYLRSALSKQNLHFGFLSGGVTFCSMLPMRSIPFRVICLLGMNEADFPRTTQSLGFDLMADSPRIGDRSRNLDDRYLFLETLLSARDALCISFVGQSIREGKPIPPSVLVSELLDYIDRNVRWPDGAAGERPADRLLVVHPLQAFSFKYFLRKPFAGKGLPGKDVPDVSRLFSYSRENYEAARVLRGERTEERPFVAHDISPPEEALRIVDLKELWRFFRHPVKYLLGKRMRLRLELTEETADPREPFTLSGLERYDLAQELVERSMAGEDLEALLPVVRARGILPHRRAGEVAYQDLVSDVMDFSQRFEALSKGQYVGTQEIELELDSFRLRGHLELWERGQFRYRCADVKVSDEIALWIYHLAFNAALDRRASGSRIVRAQSTFLGRSGAVSFEPATGSAGLLRELLAIYWRGLSFPVAFFPQTSFRYSQAIFRGESEERALRAAEGVWSGGFVRGEGADPYYRLVYGESLPLGKDFQDTALKILIPLLQHRVKVKKA
jgi:exodeoxyribonuclease V gamma subunit